MSRHHARIAALVAVVLSLTACATYTRRGEYQEYYWSYVRTPLDPFWWNGLVDVPGARLKAGTGTGTTVAIIGTGVLAGHEDLPTITTGASTCGSDTDDKNGHGTQLAGIAAGLDPGRATKGVAPGAAIIPIKIDCGVVSADTLTRGIDAAIARKPDVVLLAIGGYPAGQPDVPTFMLDRVTRNRDILFVVASAWDGATYGYPAWTQEANALTVAAMTLDADARDRTKVTSKEIPYSARRGQIWAPGRNVATADIEVQMLPVVVPLGHSQFLMHGTSPAAAIVAGCAALVKSKSGLSGAALRTALVSKAEPKPDLPGPSGRLNCATAVP
jgi:subtilisin family serine protease